MKSLLLILLLAAGAMAQSTQPFDGSKWNVSTGNLSVTYIQASPIGAHPRPLEFEPPPTVEAMAKMKAEGLLAYEDYIAWGAVEREEGKFNWSQHDKVYGVNACILGPCGEGNYPLNVPDWVNIGHCHEGYWCADEHALAAFRAAMIRKYLTIAVLNKAWGTEFKSFDDVRPPMEIAEK